MITVIGVNQQRNIQILIDDDFEEVLRFLKLKFYMTEVDRK